MQHTKKTAVQWHDQQKTGLLSTTQGSHASWKVVDLFLENSRTWKVQDLRV